MIKTIDEKGFARIGKLGSIKPYNLIDARIQTESGVQGVMICEKKEDMGKITHNDLYIDFATLSPEKVREKVRVGEVAITRSEYYENEECVMMQCLDDRIGCMIIIDSILRDVKNTNDMYYVFSVQEEIGCFGAQTSTFDLQPDLFVTFDVACTGDELRGIRTDVKLGGGAGIKAMDYFMIVNQYVVDALVDVAEKNGIKYQIEVSENGGTDAHTAQLVRGGMKAGAITIPTRNIHSRDEIICKEDILDCIRTIYGIRHKNGAIRRVNVNIAATTVEEYRMLKDAGIGTYILFQETYHKQSYEKLHPAGPKHDYAWHTEAMDRAMQGGIDDVGLGVLFGLEGYRYEFAALLMHAEHLEAVHGVGPHTISVPRIKKADDIDPDVFDNGIDDETFARICACIRVAVPYTGMIISTRESQAVREKVLPLGVSQISGASRTSVGGYCEPEPEDENSAQFDVSDRRTLDEVVRWLMDQGHIPSFCTACYREGRTGDRFMSLCKSRQILNCCHPNALLTLKEYLQDYASPATRAVGLDMITKELDKIPSDKVRARTIRCLDAIEAGQRDFRF